jgi:hypothetical protein
MENNTLKTASRKRRRARKRPPLLRGAVSLARYLAGERGRGASLARALRVAPSTVHRWSLGHYLPHDLHRAGLAEHAGITPDLWEAP